MPSKKQEKSIIENRFKYCFHKMLKDDIQRRKCFLNTGKSLLKVLSILDIISELNPCTW